MEKHIKAERLVIATYMGCTQGTLNPDEVYKRIAPTTHEIVPIDKLDYDSNYSDLMPVVNKLIGECDDEVVVDIQDCLKYAKGIKDLYDAVLNAIKLINIKKMDAAFMTKDEIKEAMNHFHEIDIDNCTMTHRDWINVVAEALTNPNHLKDFVQEYKVYLEERLD